MANKRTKKQRDEEHKAYYYDTWYDLFGNVLGWTKGQVDAWADRFRDRKSGKLWLDEPNNLVYHELPAYYASPWFVPEKVLDMLPSHSQDYVDRHMLVMDVRDAVFAASDEPGGGAFKRTDWRALRVKINAVVNQYRNAVVSKWLESD